MQAIYTLIVVVKATLRVSPKGAPLRKASAFLSTSTIERENTDSKEHTRLKHFHNCNFGEWFCSTDYRCHLAEPVMARLN